MLAADEGHEDGGLGTWCRAGGGAAAVAAAQSSAPVSTPEKRETERLSQLQPHPRRFLASNGPAEPSRCTSFRFRPSNTARQALVGPSCFWRGILQFLMTVEAASDDGRNMKTFRELYKRGI